MHGIPGKAHDGGLERWIVLFRGVGGKTQLPTAPLRAALSGAGFRDVATYINSGNAVVTAGADRAVVSAVIGEICARSFGFTKAIHLASLREWADLVARNPFPEALCEPKFLHAALLASEPAPRALAALRAAAQGRDRIEVVGRVAYLHTPDGFGRSKLAERFDRDIGVPNTARNWNTVVRLDEIARSAEGFR